MADNVHTNVWKCTVAHKSDDCVWYASADGIWYHNIGQSQRRSFSVMSVGLNAAGTL